MNFRFDNCFYLRILDKYFMKANLFFTFLIILILTFSNCTNKLPGDTKANLGLLSFLSRIKSTPAIPCRKYAKKTNMKISALNTSTGITVERINSTTCDFDLNTKSMFCVYEYPIGFFGNVINNDRKIYKNVLDFIEEKNIPGKDRQISEIDNEDPLTKKDYSYTTDGKLIQILEANGTVSNIDSYDSFGRPLTRKTKIGACFVPAIQTFDDLNKNTVYSIFFSLSTPAACPVFFSNNSFPDLKLEFFYNSEFFITKLIQTSGLQINTTTYTTVEIGEVCKLDSEVSVP